MRSRLSPGWGNTERIRLSSDRLTTCEAPQLSAAGVVLARGNRASDGLRPLEPLPDAPAARGEHS